MLWAIFISSDSGNLVYSKQFKQCVENPRMLVALFKAIMEKAQVYTQLNLAHLHFSKCMPPELHISPYIVNICLTRHKSGAYCIQVLESRNGKAFAEILGEAILSDFTAVCMTNTSFY